MKEIYKNLYIGNDSDFDKVKDDDQWRIVRACKNGVGGHRDTLGYEHLSAPKGPDYLFTERGNRLSLNMIDTHDPDYIPDEMVDRALAYIRDQIKDHKILIACNQGKSRSPSLALLYLYSEGKLPKLYPQALRMFRKLYPRYDPSAGAQIYVRRKLSQLKAN